MKTTCVLAMFSILTACASIPKETVTLSQTLGDDLEVLHQAHRKIMKVHFEKVKDDIHSFIDDTYAPFIIHFVLKKELEAYQTGEPSLYTTIEVAGQKGGKQETEAALNEMSDFQIAARKQVESKRNELLLPLINQEAEIIRAVDRSYENAIYANATITGYLQSVRNVKGAQQEALSMIGLSGTDTLITNTLVKASDLIGEAVKKGKEIDIRSEDAYMQLESISDRIKEITNKK